MWSGPQASSSVPDSLSKDSHLVGAAEFKGLYRQNTSKSYIKELFIYFSSVDMLLLKDYKTFWITNFLTIYEVPPPLKQVSPEKNMAFICIVTGKKIGHQIWSPEKNQALKWNHQKKFKGFFLVIPFESLIFFPVVKFDVQIFSGDTANESHIFSGDTCFKGGGTSWIDQKFVFQKIL